MKLKIFLQTIVLMLFCGLTNGYADQQQGASEAGRWEVKNVKRTVLIEKAGQESFNIQDELIKIDTATGEVWANKTGVTQGGEYYDQWEEVGTQERKN